MFEFLKMDQEIFFLNMLCFGSCLLNKVGISYDLFIILQINFIIMILKL